MAGAMASTTALPAYANWYLDNDGWSDGVDHRAAGGNSGNRGSASTSSSAHAVAVAWPTQGTGIEDNPFIISSTDDWNGFANFVNGDYTFSGQFVKLSSNIRSRAPSTATATR